MTEIDVRMTEAEWQQVLACMSYAPGRECIPLMNKMGEQIRLQSGAQLAKQFSASPLAEPEALRKRNQ